MCTEGVVRWPSELVIIVGCPPSITAIAEFVVPRSMPTTFSAVTRRGPALLLCFKLLSWQFFDIRESPLKNNFSDGFCPNIEHFRCFEKRSLETLLRCPAIEDGENATDPRTVAILNEYTCVAKMIVIQLICSKRRQHSPRLNSTDIAQLSFVSIFSVQLTIEDD